MAMAPISFDAMIASTPVRKCVHFWMLVGLVGLLRDVSRAVVSIFKFPRSAILRVWAFGVLVRVYV